MTSFIVRNTLRAVSIAVNSHTLFYVLQQHSMCNAINCVTYPLLGCVTIRESRIIVVGN